MPSNRYSVEPKGQKDSFGRYDDYYIQKAIDSASADGGGVVVLSEGVYTIKNPIQLKRGASIRGIYPQIQLQANCPNLGYSLSGGTILQGDGAKDLFVDNAPTGGTVTFDTGNNEVDKTAHGFSDGDSVVFTTDGTLPTGLESSVGYFVVNATTDSFQVSSTIGGDALTFTSGAGAHTVHGNEGLGVIIENLGVNNVKRVIASGAENSIGLSYSVIRNLIIDTTEDWAVEIYNSQELVIDNIKVFDAKRGVRLVASHAGCAPGLITLRDCNITLQNLFSSKADYARRYGFSIENVLSGGLQIDAVRMYSCFAVAYGPNGGGSSFGVVDGDVSTGGDTITETAHGLSNGDPIRFGGTDLPAGITEDFAYFVKSVTANTFQLSTLEDLSDTVNITDVGSGTRTAYYYPGDTVGVNIKGGASGENVGAPEIFGGLSDGVMNNFYRLENVVSGTAIIDNFGANSHGPRPISGLNCKRFHWLPTSEATELYMNSSSIPWFLTGTSDLTEGSSNPATPYVDATSTALTIPLGSTRAMQSDITDGSFGIRVESNNTWPSMSIAPCYRHARSSTDTMSKDRVGTTRFTGQGSTVVLNLPAVNDLAPGAVVFAHNHDGTNAVTLTTSGAETINSSGTTRTIAADQMAICTADNAQGRTNWIVSIIAVATK